MTSRVGSTCGDDVVREVVGFGFDRDRERFFWLAALGGSGIMAAPH